MPYRLICFFLLLFFMSSAVTGQGIESFILDNGLKVIVKPDHRAPVAVVQIWYKVGSADESPGKRGISHLLEHMMFKSYNNPLLAEDFRQLTRVGARRNAYTQRDYTFYYYILNKAYLEWVIHLEAQRMQGLFANEASLKIEKKIIQEEINSQLSKDPFYSLNDRLYKLAFQHSGYQYPIIGNIKDIQQLSLAQIKQWHQQYYTPDNAILVVTGDVKTSDVFKWASDYFSIIKKKRSVPFKTSTSESALAEIHSSIPGTFHTGKLLMAFRVPSIKTAVPVQDAYALEVLAGWLDSGVHSRLTDALIWDKQQAQDLSIRYTLMTRYDSLFIIEAIPLHGVSMQQLENALVQELEVIKKHPISQSELQKVKNQMIAAEIFEQDSSYIQAKIIGQAEVIDIPWSIDAQYIERIKAVTPEQIQQVLKKYFTANNRIIITSP